MTETALLAHLVGVPWVIHAPALQTLIELAQRQPPDPSNLDAWKRLTAQHSPEAVAFRTGQPLPGARRATLRDGGVAVIRVQGPIFRHANLFTEMSGATALATVAGDLQVALDDSRVRGILLEFDSPGGQAMGIAEVANAIRAAAGQKPVAAYVDGLGASAAYWLVAAAGEVVVAPTAMLGSLGAVLSVPPKDPRQPQPLEIVSSQTPGKRPDAYTDSGRAQLQSVVDRVAEEFLSAVATFRGVPVQQVLDGTGGGGLVVGKDAIAAGMADRVGSFEQLLADLSQRDRGGLLIGGGRATPAAHASTSTPHAMGDPMPESDTQAAPVAAEPTPTPQPEAAAPPAAPPAPAAAADPIATERARVAAILSAQKPAFSALAQLAVAQGWTPETFAEAQAAAEAGAASAQAGAYAGSFPAPVATAPAEPAAPPADPAAALRAEWDKDAKLRAEFGSFEAFAAFERNRAAGRIRLLRRVG